MMIDWTLMLLIITRSLFHYTERALESEIVQSMVKLFQFNFITHDMKNKHVNPVSLQLKEYKSHG